MADGRLLTTRYAGTCIRCGATVARGEQAWWEPGPRQLWCLACHGCEGGDRSVGPSTGPPEPTAGPAPDAGEAGRSAQARFDHLQQARAASIDRRWGRLAGVVKFLTSDPSTTSAWAKGAEGERRVAHHLQRLVGGGAVFLHDRRIPASRANIDLLAVAPSGIWVVDAKHWTGRVERRQVGGWFSSDLRLCVGGRDRTMAIAGMARQVAAVRQVVKDPGVPVVPALCFVAAEWGLRAKPFRIEGVWVTWASPLAEMLLGSGPLDGESRMLIARALSTGLPAM